MQMEAFLWLFLPVFVAGGSALLSYYVMQARMEVALAKERESLAEARAMISAHKVTLDERVKATEEACKRQALDDFMHDIRVDERSYVRESKSLNGSKKTMVMQERVFFRNIRSNEQMLIEDGPATATGEWFAGVQRRGHPSSEKFQRRRGLQTTSQLALRRERRRHCRCCFRRRVGAQ
jgi:hypothetical protein